MNSAAIARPDLLGEIADRFGAQVLVLSLDVKRSPRTASGFVVTTHGGRQETELDALAWAARRRSSAGAGELLVNSIDADGTKQGFDLELIPRDARGSARSRSSRAGEPGPPTTSPPAVEAGADAVLAASVFHDGILSIADVKAELASAGAIVRTEAAA